MVSGQHIEFSSEPVHITKPSKGVVSDKERSVITSDRDQDLTLKGCDCESTSQTRGIYFTHFCSP